MTKLIFTDFPETIQIDDTIYSFACLNEDDMIAIENGDRDMDWLSAGYTSVEGHTYECQIDEAERLNRYYRRRQQEAE